MAAPLAFPYMAAADPLERHDAGPAGAESWWSPPGSESAPCCDYVEVELGYDQATLAREKEDAQLQSLLMQRGPELRVTQEAPRWFSEFRLSARDVEAGRSGTFGMNRLDGARARVA